MNREEKRARIERCLDAYNAFDIREGQISRLTDMS